MTTRKKSIEAKRRLAIASFEPGKAVRLLNKRSPRHQIFMRPWMLVQLLAWAILDQEPGRHQSKPNVDNDAVQRPALKRRNARDAGNYALALLLHRRLSSRHRTGDKTLTAMNRLLEIRGGVRVYLFAEKSAAMFGLARRVERKLHYVYWIVDYLCRYRKHIGGEVKFDIETAKQFLEQYSPEGDESYGTSKIEKIWLNYKNSAPYIFAFYPFLSRPLKQGTDSPEQVLYFIEKLASDEERLKRLLGRAAYAADILNILAHRVRITDFKDIERAEPPLRRFNSTELAMINNIDRRAAIA